jgi:hypothetical protein
MLRSCLHLTQPLSWSTNPCQLSATAYSIYSCQLSATAYSIYSHLANILKPVRPSTTPGRAMPWCQVPTYLGYIAYYDGFIITWFRRCIVFMYNKYYCFHSSWYVSFLETLGKVTYHALHSPFLIPCFKSITIVCRVKRYA